jgi:UDP-glucose 6-dehydrogenase
MGKYKDRVGGSENLETLINKHKSIKLSLDQALAMKISIGNEISDLASAVSTEDGTDAEDIAEVNALDTLYKTIFKNGNGQPQPNP